MYPAFTTTRPQLPSILSVNQPLEQYRIELRKRSPLCSGTDIEPLDAYLAHLLVSCHLGEPIIFDTAAEATAGASTLLALLHPRQPRVFAAGGPLPGDRRAYRNTVEDFLNRYNKSPSTPQWLSHTDPVSELHGESDAIVFVTANAPQVDAEVEELLNAIPSAVVLVFGLGEVGACAAIDAFLQHFPTGCRRRFSLLRDCGEALSASRLGLVAERDNDSAQAARKRLQQMFAGNYSFLGLLRSAAEKAIRSTGSDTAVRESNHILFRDWNQEINQLKQAAQQARETVAAREEEVRTLRESRSYRLGERLLLLRRQLAPDGTWRYRLFQRLRRCGQIWRQGGIRALLRRIASRCLHR